MTLLDVRVSIDYPGRPGVLDEACFTVRRGEIVGLVGSSGSGKSSLALALLRLLECKGGRASGSVRFEGRELMECKERELRAIRGKEIAFVPQSPSSSLNPALRLRDQMMEAYRAHGRGTKSDGERQVRRVIEQVGLPADTAFLRRYPGEVSIGQAQRVLIAMAILHGPSLLIADEATSSLDLISQAEVLRLLARLNRECGMGMLYISHDLAQVAGFCDRVAILHGGRIVEFGETARIFEAPQHPYAQALIGALPERIEKRRPMGAGRLSQQMIPRVLIATSEPVLAKGLEAVLLAGGLEVTDICKDIFEVFDSFQRRRPDVAILDMPVLPAQEILRDLYRVAPKCRMVLWPRTSLSRDPAKLVEAINMLTAFSESNSEPSALVDLACSAAERELITLIGYGLSNEEIAWAMSADAATVQKLVKKVSDKLGAEDRYELAMYGLSTLNDAGKFFRPQEEGI